MKEPEVVSLPPVNPEEYRILMAGLGELPCKISRVLYNKLQAHVQAQLQDDPPSC
jgi:hypothetical protein